MSEKFEENQRPFAEELSPSPYGREDKLYELKSHPHLVVRREKGSYVSSDKERLAEVVAELKETKELFASLEDDGMYVAKFNQVIGNKEPRGRTENYVLIEKIDGKNLKEMNTLDADAAEEVDQCYAGYLTHLLRVLREGGRYWDDMNQSQIVYGTREGDAVPHAYVVDVEPYVSTWMNAEERRNDPPKTASNLRWLVLSTLQPLAKEITFLEKKCEKGTELKRARAKFCEILETLRPIVAEDPSPSFRNEFSVLETKLTQAGKTQA